MMTRPILEMMRKCLSLKCSDRDDYVKSSVIFPVWRCNSVYGLAWPVLSTVKCGNIGQLMTHMDCKPDLLPYCTVCSWLNIFPRVLGA